MDKEEKEKTEDTDFRSDRFTWKDGDLKFEDKYPDEEGTVFWTYYACKEEYERLKEEREKKNGGS